jgi:hypothetical protein
MGDSVMLRIEIGGDGADAADLDDETVGLRAELLDLDVDAVDRPVAGPAPDGARAVDTVVAGLLLVELGKGVIGSVLRSVEAWVARRRSRTVKLSVAGDTIELSNASPAEQRELLEAFLARHAAPAG